VRKEETDGADEGKTNDEDPKLGSEPPKQRQKREAGKQNNSIKKK
jgi:hypothetical protein